MVASPSMRRHVRLAPLRPLPLLLPLLVLCQLGCPALCAAPISSFSVPFTTYGPHFANPAGVARVNATIYGGRLPYPDLSWPVLKIATPNTLLGPYNTYATLLLSVMPFAVDMINAHGGLYFNGTRYLLACTVASDDSSTDYLQYIYSQWLNDPSYILFFQPPIQAQQVAIWPLVQGTNRTWTSILTLGSGVLPDYPYRFNMLPSWYTSPPNTLNTINARAQLYHQEVVNGTAIPPDGTVTSPYGLLTICLYAHNDSSVIDEARGVRAWVNQTNAARLAAGAQASDLITIVQDVFWGLDASSVDQALYERSFNLCPDNVDLLIACGEISTPDMMAVTAALEGSLLRPKVAYSTSSALDYNATDPTMARTWRWWVTGVSKPVLQASLQPVTFYTLAEMGGAFAYYTGGLPNIGHVLVMSMVEVIKVALARSASLSSDDLRAAFLSLNGSTFAQRIGFNGVTGNNDASTSIPYQLQPTGSVAIQNLTQMLYPAPFPWRRTVVGDDVTVVQAGSTVVVAVVISVLGCWVAQIMLEQAVYVRRRGGWYQLWLLVVALALGGSGVWCTQFAMAGALSFSTISTGELPVSWSLPVALMAWMPALLLTWCALMVGMRDFQDQSDDRHGSGAAFEARQAHRHREEAKRKQAALDTAEHWRHLGRSISRHTIAASVLLLVAVVLSRVALMYVWSVQARASATAGAWLVSVLVCGPVYHLAVLVYFHGLRRRPLGVFILAGAICLDWQAHVTVSPFTYSSTVLSTPASLYAVLLSSSAVTLICGIVAALTCFGFVGLQFSRMQLSRNGLSVLVATMEDAIRKQRRINHAQEDELRAVRLQTDAMAKVLECIALLRPLHGPFSLALSTQANAATLRMLFDPALDSSAAPTATGLTSTLKGRSSTGAETDKNNTVLTRLGVKRQPLHLRRTSVAGSASSRSGSVNHDTALVEPTAADSPTAAAVADGTEVSARRTASISAWMAKPDDAAAVPSASDSAAITSDSTERPSEAPRAQPALQQRQMSRSHHSHSSTDDPTTPSSRTLPAPDSAPSDNEGGAPEALDTAAAGEEASTAGSSSSAHSQDTRVASWKQFESDVLSALQLQAQRATTSHPHSTDGSSGAAALGDFSFLLPSIAASNLSRPEAATLHRASLVAGSTSGSGSTGCPFPTPSLQQLLQHPVCVELVRDELTRTHSEENLTFYLHALRYGRLQSAALRRPLAALLADAYIVDGAAQQINVSTAQRTAVTAALRRRGDDGCGPTMLAACEREVLLLMETNMKGWWGGLAHRLCVWMYHAVDVKRVVGWQREEGSGAAGADAEGGDGGVEPSRRSSLGTYLRAAKQPVRSDE